MVGMTPAYLDKDAQKGDTQGHFVATLLLSFSGASGEIRMSFSSKVYKRQLEDQEAVTRHEHSHMSGS